MASVKVKFRPSSVNGKEGSIYYQVIYNRVVRQIRTDYRIFEPKSVIRPHIFLSVLYIHAFSRLFVFY